MIIHNLKILNYFSALVMCPTLSNKNLTQMLFVPHLASWDLVTLDYSHMIT